MHYTFCRICEASCGLEVEVQDNRVTKIRPDAAHPVSFYIGNPCGFLKRGLLTKSGRVELAPADFITTAEAELDDRYEAELRSRSVLKLISKREKRGHNSWMHNTPALGGKAHQTNRLYMHPDDALEAGLAEGDLAENTEALSGMAQLTAFPVQVKPADTTGRSEEQ